MVIRSVSPAVLQAVLNALSVTMSLTAALVADRYVSHAAATVYGMVVIGLVTAFVGMLTYFSEVFRGQSQEALDGWRKSSDEWERLCRDLVAINAELLVAGTSAPDRPSVVRH